MALPSGDEMSTIVKLINTPKRTINVFRSKTPISTVFAQAGNIAIGLAGGVLALQYPTKSFISSFILSLETRTLSIIFKEFSKIIFEQC